MSKPVGLLIILLLLQMVVKAQGIHVHKKEIQLARMTPEALVKEYCKEYQNHQGLFHDDYEALLDKYLGNAGVKALPPIIRIIDEYQPTQQNQLFNKGDRFDLAIMLLSWFDASVFRLRAFAEGKLAIQALKRAAERMQTAQFNDQRKSQEFEKQSRHKLTMISIKMFEGVNEIADVPDRSVGDTLRVVYGVNLSDSELKDFIGFLIVRDAFYPSWSKREFQRHDEKVLFILKNPKPFYQAYLDFKAKK